MTGRTCLDPAGRQAPPRPRQVPARSPAFPPLPGAQGLTPRGAECLAPVRVPRPFTIRRLGGPGATSPALVRGGEGTRLLQEPVWAAPACASTRFLRPPPASRSLSQRSLLWDLPHVPTSPTSPGDSRASALQGVGSPVFHHLGKTPAARSPSPTPSLWKGRLPWDPPVAGRHLDSSTLSRPVCLYPTGALQIRQVVPGSTLASAGWGTRHSGM
nr:uncharacterized protein LOC110123459 [Odocoileus virginianus texanus]